MNKPASRSSSKDPAGKSTKSPKPADSEAKAEAADAKDLKGPSSEPFPELSTFLDKAKEPQLVPKPAAQRLSLYLRYLEALEAQAKETISSQSLGSALGLTAAQVRKDLGHFGQFGFPGVGYKIPELIRQIRHIMGTDRIWRVALVGMGNLGSALARYKGFEQKGFQIAALFDRDPQVVGKRFPPGTVHPMSRLTELVQEKEIQLGILAVPAEEAQGVAEEMIAAGIQGILNFAPRVLRLFPQILCVSVDLAIQLEQLTLCLSMRERSEGTTAAPSPRTQQI
ncbi:MAG: redox-sensing transcriptional repressor Rex [Planctomycetes bacterium]|nr:redox-sensing transcriptional repressor Rex [Planctomycetota bacterium]